ncbi:hypothetical protein WN944_024028 [Citrus x changshan-huyou]|uniref:Uncharacterized protein n=1 Tax=Citrus x changshan-huyou TaxID=2935761 RepID=A0AAP0QFC0_9ROSI
MAVIVVWVCEAVKVWLSAVVCCCFMDGRFMLFPLPVLGGEVFGRTDVKERADAVSSVVALIGVGGSILGVKFLDPLAGLVISGIILKAGLETGYQSVLELVDAAIPAENLMPIRETILKVEGVKGCHRLRGRRAGSSLYLDVHIVQRHIRCQDVEIGEINLVYSGVDDMGPAISTRSKC